MTLRIPSADLTAVYRRYQAEFDEAVSRVLWSGRYVLGDEVEAFEAEFADALGVSHVVSVANGTDAVELSLRAAGVPPGGRVVTVSHTAVATVAAVARAGAVPVMVDIDPVTYTMSPDALAQVLEGAEQVAAVVPVHLYGYPADMEAIGRLAAEAGALVVEDAAQAHGATTGGRAAGALGTAGAFSFYPTKNLGAFGDAGAVATGDDSLAQRLAELRQYGWRRRVSETEGMNSRLDELQAAVLRVRLRHLTEETAHRRTLARIYDEALDGLPIARPPAPDPDRGVDPVYHQYVVGLPPGSRPGVQAVLSERGIGSAIHYPVPVHLQPAYSHLATPGGMAVTESVCGNILSLPIGPHVDEGQVVEVASAVGIAIAASRS